MVHIDHIVRECCLITIVIVVEGVAGISQDSFWLRVHDIVGYMVRQYTLFFVLPPPSVL